MSNTTNFDLKKVTAADAYDIDDFNGNMDIIDTEMAKPPLTVNDQSPNASRNIQITTVPLADNLTSDEAQIISGTFAIRSSGGGASISNGAAMLSDIKGNMIKTGYVPESINMTVTPASIESDLAATIDRDTFVSYVGSSGTITLTYTSDWSADPSLYGITVTGTPESGDVITVVYVKENRGTITVANPTSFISTGWNLYNHSAGYAKVCKYSDEYGFMIDGTYQALKFATTLSGEQTTITPTNGYFTIPSDGYVFVTGGNATDTEIWMTWSDWTDEPNGGVFEAYSQSVIDLSGVMVSFPYGLMRVGNTYDEIDLNVGRAYSRIERLSYAENIESVIESGKPYDTDTNYVYVVKDDPTPIVISLDGEYTVNDHGVELFNGTSVAVVTTILYGDDLKNKLRRDVLTISEQTLTDAQKAQVKQNIGYMTPASAGSAGKGGFVPAPGAGAQNNFLRGDATWVQRKDIYRKKKTVGFTYTYSLNNNTSLDITATQLKLAAPEGYEAASLVSLVTGDSGVVPVGYRLGVTGSEWAVRIRNISGAAVSGKTLYIAVVFMEKDPT